MNIKLMRSSSKVPAYAKEDDAGFDLNADITEELLLFPNEIVAVPTGICIELPSGYTGMVVPRSGQAKRGLTVANAPGIVDAGYRGEILVLAHNISGEILTILPGERIAQLVIVDCWRVNFEVVDELSSSERNTSGFGSSGIK